MSMAAKPTGKDIPQLTAEQEAELERWLCDEERSCAEVRRRLSARFGLDLPAAEIRRIHDEHRQRRMLERIASSRAAANRIVREFKSDPANMYAAVVNLVGQAAFEAALEGERMDAALVTRLARLVVEAKRYALAEAHFELQREKWQFDAAEACLKKLPELIPLHSQPGLSEKEKISRIRRALFGGEAE